MGEKHIYNLASLNPIFTRWNFLDAKNPTKEENEQAEENFKEEYLEYLTLDGSDNSRFGTIKTDLENKMTCGSGSYPKSKEKTVVLLNNYHARKQLTRTTPLKEELSLKQTKINTKMNKTTNKEESKSFQ